MNKKAIHFEETILTGIRRAHCIVPENIHSPTTEGICPQALGCPIYIAHLKGKYHRNLVSYQKIQNVFLSTET